MTRRTLLKLVALLPFAGPAIAKSLAKSQCIPGPACAPAFIPYLPAEFPKWDKAVDGLEEAGKWALETERSLLPEDVIVPRAGQVWTAVRDCEVTFRPLFCRPRPHDFTARSPNDLARMLMLMMGGSAPLRRGERIRILGADDPRKPLRVTFQPVRCEELHAGIVPEDIRGTPGYLGYELSVKTAKTIADYHQGQHQTYFNEAFRLVEGAR